MGMIKIDRQDVPAIITALTSFLLSFLLSGFLLSPQHLLIDSAGNVASLRPNGPIVGSQDDQGRKIDEVFDLQGKLFSQTNLFSDRNNGFYRTFYPDGSLAKEIIYRGGWEVSDKAFDPSGQPLKREGMVETHYADGSLESVGKYYHDLKQGEFKSFYYDGMTVVDRWQYLDGRRVGIHVRNDSNGNFLFQEDWGYPTSYVRKLQNIIAAMALIFVVILFWAWIKVRHQAQGRQEDQGI